MATAINKATGELRESIDATELSASEWIIYGKGNLPTDELLRFLRVAPASARMLLAGDANAKDEPVPVYDGRGWGPVIGVLNPHTGQAAPRPTGAKIRWQPPAFSIPLKGVHPDYADVPYELVVTPKLAEMQLSDSDSRVAPQWAAWLTDGLISDELLADKPEPEVAIKTRKLESARVAAIKKLKDTESARVAAKMAELIGTDAKIEAALDAVQKASDPREIAAAVEQLR